MKVKLLKKIRDRYSIMWYRGELRVCRFNRRGQPMYFKTIQQFIYWYVEHRIGYITLCDYMEKMIKRGRKRELITEQA